MNNIYRIIKIVKWVFSKDKKVFDFYIEKFKNLESFSEMDSKIYKEVATIRKTIFAHK